jgi:hypothetical protein
MKKFQKLDKKRVNAKHYRISYKPIHFREGQIYSKNGRIQRIVGRIIKQNIMPTKAKLCICDVRNNMT